MYIAMLRCAWFLSVAMSMADGLVPDQDGEFLILLRSILSLETFVVFVL